MAGRPKKTTVEAKPKKEKKVATPKKQLDTDILAEANVFQGNFNLAETDKEALDNLIEKVETKDFSVSEKAIEEIYAHKISIEPNMEAILAKYEEKVNTASDINQLLPYIRAVAEVCPVITEFGVRQPTSTYALLAGNPQKLTSYDVYKDDAVAEVEEIAPNFTFILGDTLQIEIEETDFLFVDTVHTATQLERELARHASKVRKYIGFHDIQSFGHVGEYYQGINPEINCGRGLWAALTPFLQNNLEWKIDFQTEINNGLLILRRI